MFKITQNKGVHFTFANGYTVSVQWGAGNYGDNYGSHDYSGPADPSSLAEVAAWDANGNWHQIGDCGDVAGYQTPNQVLEIMNKVAAL